MSVCVDTEDEGSICDAIEHFKKIIQKNLSDIADFDKKNGFSALPTQRFNANLLLHDAVKNLNALVKLQELLLTKVTRG